MQNEKIIEKIKKVLELSRNNPSAEEAKAAALKAQKLMAEYHISMSEVDAVEDVEKIVENRVSVGSGNKWKYQLATIVARNFRCRTFYYGSKIVVFYGYETDTQIAAETFKYLFKTGNVSAGNYYSNTINAYYREVGRGEGAMHTFDGRGIKNDFILGYMRGISDALDKQCTALMIVTPPEVHESANVILKGSKQISASLQAGSLYAQAARSAGYMKGKEAMSANKLESKAI